MSERAAREPDGPAGIPEWERLTPSARQALCDLARIFADKVNAQVRVVTADGQKRDFRVELDDGAYRKLSARTA